MRDISDWMQLEPDDDALTGLPNSRSFADTAIAALAQDDALSIVIFDVDGMKHINDYHGLPVGDEMLAAIATRLATLMLPGETLGRIGGDHFAALLPAERAHELAEAGTSRNFGYSISAGYLAAQLRAGVAIAPENGTSFAQLIEAADQGLAIAKRRVAQSTLRPISPHEP